jgi:hypothetical protein
MSVPVMIRIPEDLYRRILAQVEKERAQTPERSVPEMIRHAVMIYLTAASKKEAKS